MALSQTAMDTELRRLFAETFTQQNDGQAAPELQADTVLLDTGLDSLGFAILVTRLEEDLGFDPFSLSQEAYYPVTYDDFLRFYLAHQPQ
jgi:acyl carrier protein